MKRINLLPHRAEKRRAKQIQFIAFSVISIVLAGILVAAVQGVIDAKIAYQDRRNAYLKQETVVLDKQIEEIRKLREQTRELLARKNVVEGLQGTRSDVVHLLDQMLRILPDGIYIKTLKQTGNTVSMVGYAQSNSRISTLMRAIEDSLWLEPPVLKEIHTVTASGSRVGEFTLSFELTKPKLATAVPATKPAAPKS